MKRLRKLVAALVRMRHLAAENSWGLALRYQLSQVFGVRREFTVTLHGERVVIRSGTPNGPQRREAYLRACRARAGLRAGSPSLLRPHAGAL